MTQSLSPKPSPDLPENAVHVWRVPLNHSSERTLLSLKVLSPDEREKAARFHFDKDKNQFVQSRAALRFILSEYLHVNPQNLEFAYGTHGKPALANGHAESSLRFNLSRRDGLALIAVTRGREIGVDVELIRANVPCFEIAAVSFSAAESANLRSLPESLRVAGFYNCWTRKEAYVKARGEGLSFPLKQFDVSLPPGDPAMLLNVRDDDDEVDRWTLQEIPVSENYVAALVVEGGNLNLTCRDWDWSQQRRPGSGAVGLGTRHSRKRSEIFSSGRRLYQSRSRLASPVASSRGSSPTNGVPALAARWSIGRA